MSTGIQDRPGTHQRKAHNRFRARWPVLLGVIVLTYLVCAVFFPLLNFQFIDYDVRSQIFDNQHIKGLTAKNVKHIFTSRCVTSYYPVRTLTFAADYELWGLNPGGFKLTNGLIHLTNVLLVFWLVLRLFRRPTEGDESRGGWWDVVVATFSAGIFAVHPVVVEPVAWVPGREELLMTLGALGCIHFHITARRFGEEPGRARWAMACHAAAAFCCAAACLSNAVAAVIPLVILAWDLLTLTRPTARKLFGGTAVLWVLGLTTIVLKQVGSYYVGVSEADPSSAQHAIGVLRVYCQNLRTFVWPTDLALAYPPFELGSFLEAEVILGGIAIALTGLILWTVRRQKLVLFGLLWFGLALAPSSQVMVHHIPRADRFLYLPLAGLAVAIALGVRPLGRLLKNRVALGGVIAVGVCGLLVLDTLSIAQVSTWEDEITVFQQALKVGPRNAMVHYSLADRLAVRGHSRLAAQTYREAMRLHPDDERILINYAWLLASCNDDQIRDFPAAIDFAEQACRLTEWEEPKYLQALASIHFAFADSLAKQGELGQVSENYAKAVDAMLRLALRLATFPEKRFRRPDEAVQLAKRACQLMGRPSSLQLSNLAEVYAETGRFDEAISTMQRAIGLAHAAGDQQRLAELRRRLRLYQSRGSGP